jgi:hypothetical protein
MTPTAENIASIRNCRECMSYIFRQLAQKKISETQAIIKIAIQNEKMGIYLGQLKKEGL